MIVLTIFSWLAAIGPAPAQELTDRVYIPDFDAICAEGQRLGEGCDAIRARRIEDAATPPWSAIGRLNHAAFRSHGYCTGTLVGEKLVLTAAHCLYNSRRKRWIPARGLHFVAGFQRGERVAASPVLRYVLAAAQDRRSRDFAGGVANDWALVELAKPIGRKAGVIRPLTVDETELDRMLRAGPTVLLAGYSKLRQYVLSVDTDCERAVLVDAENTLLHGCAAMSGDSGAPLLTWVGDELRIVGIMVGFESDGNTVNGLAVPISLFTKLAP